MRILAIADEEAKYFYDYYQPGRLDDIDLIVSCGDLSRHYLEFLVTMARCPLFYVHGNHDDSFDDNPPEGCVCIDDKIVVYKGVRFMGLGGSYRYKKDSRHMFTEGQMRFRITKLMPAIWKNRGFDVLVTHAPARGIGDLEDLPHRGFECFVKLLEVYKPRLFLHGHIHRSYGYSIPQKRTHGETTIINAYEYCRVDD